MEKSVWNNRDIALEKSTLPNDLLDYHLNQGETRFCVEENERDAKQVIVSTEGVEGDIVSYFEKNTKVDGSIKISDINPKSSFFSEEGICYLDGEDRFTRGYEYVSSLDFALTSMQKIRKHEKLVHRVLGELQGDLEDMSSVEKLILLDYIKNSLITILNAFVYQEKISPEAVDPSLEYGILREKLKEYSEEIINASISLLSGDDRPLNDVVGRKEVTEVLGRVVDKLESYHLDFKLPGAYVGRPEATHPLTIMGGAFLCADRYPEVDLVVGVPSGGTEFALATKVVMSKLRNTDIPSVLVPISLHSAKQFTQEGGVSRGTQVRGILPGYLPSQILVCDDNTSTGRTLQALRELFQGIYPNATIYCTVAEADVVRSNYDKENVKRTHIADRNIYADAVNILPVSKTIEPKTDLKEILEKRRIISYYHAMENKAEKLADRIFARVMERVNEKCGDFSQFNEKNAILSFHDTFLSNFYAAPVEMNGKEYPSVEHAYQGSKFLSFDWSTLQEEVKDEIREAIKKKGLPADMDIDGNIFASTRLTSSLTKTVANILREHGVVDKEWEDRRVRVMIELLIQKFGNQDLLGELQHTKGKELIEGNDWNDTLWGVCGGKGRNLLGEILMAIRDIEHNADQG